MHFLAYFALRMTLVPGKLPKIKVFKSPNFKVNTLKIC